MKDRRYLLWLIILLTVIAIFIDLPTRIPLKFNFNGFKIDQELTRPILNFQIGKFKFFRDLEIKQGIDLAGGSHLVFQAEMSDIGEDNRETALAAARENIERRINLFGLAEALVQTSKLGDNYRLIVELPGVTDVNQAVDLIGQTAQLDFRDLSPEATAAATLDDYQETDLTGADLNKSQVQFDPNTGEPVVGLEFSDEGARKFGEITSRNVGKPVAIFLDEVPVTIPLVREKITTGKAVISGEFTTEEAKLLATQLNAGALPIPIKIVEQRNVGATLGAESVKKSVQAGLIGLLMVILFMAAYYGRLGILANVGLIIYGLITLMFYKLIPVTLTLPGIAGFILSVGMAVDANILVFERMKEEIRAGKSKSLAMELGFGRAWDSIRDANMATLITCFILFNPFSWSFLNTSGMVRGFALTLGLGVLLSLFTGVVVTRTILRTFSGKETQ
ncbi:protein-export membrane protein SecD [Microgenomates group bacterium RBG_19FT_COMBO_39_10]|nr:MAG: protein-export membrane protein SecD [Microgenomates group bacterium RBG_19FT_COMBO_39_10]